MKIFDTQFLGENVPEGFSVVKVPLNGTLTSDLDWKREYEVALNYTKQGLKIFWDMNLGVLSQLLFPLDDEGQLLSLALAIKQFKEMFWKSFYKHTAGICLYRGNVDLSADESSNDCNNLKRQLRYRDKMVEFLTLLAKELPLGLEPWLLFDTTGFHDPVHLSNLFHKECFSRFSLGVKGDILPVQQMGWDSPYFLSHYIGRDPFVPHVPRPSIAICLPEKNDFFPQHYEAIRPAFTQLSEQSRLYRLIPESFLMTECEELDEILVPPHGITPEGKRQLKGFAAAGGKVVFIPKQTQDLGFWL